MNFVYGPVPSRRLGYSLGIDIVPYKTCTLDCIYCQLGKTTRKVIERRPYLSKDDILEETKRYFKGKRQIDFITFWLCITRFEIDSSQLFLSDCFPEPVVYCGSVIVPIKTMKFINVERTVSSDYISESIAFNCVDFTVFMLPKSLYKSHNYTAHSKLLHFMRIKLI